MTDMKEFQEINMILVRNDDWLRIFRKRGFYLSEEFPVVTLQVPWDFRNMEEKDIDKLKEYIKKELSKTELKREDESEVY
jgi:hypothetical protein